MWAYSRYDRSSSFTTIPVTIIIIVVKHEPIAVNTWATFFLLMITGMEVVLEHGLAEKTITVNHSIASTRVVGKPSYNRTFLRKLLIERFLIQIIVMIYTTVAMTVNTLTAVLIIGISVIFLLNHYNVLVLMFLYWYRVIKWLTSVIQLGTTSWTFIAVIPILSKIIWHAIIVAIIILALIYSIQLFLKSIVSVFRHGCSKSYRIGFNSIRFCHCDWRLFIILTVIRSVI